VDNSIIDRRHQRDPCLSEKRRGKKGEELAEEARSD
jgi:hypothetical protein